MTTPRKRIPTSRKKNPAPPVKPPENPWDRQPKETPLAFTAFVHYRDLGLIRSLRKVSEDHSIPIDTLKGYSARNNWVTRCAAFDADRDRQDVLWVAEERRKAITRHVKQAQAITNKWLTALAGLDPNMMSPAEVIRYAEVATKMEREALQLGETLTVNVNGLERAVGAMSADDARTRLAALEREILERAAEVREVTANAGG